MGDLLEELMKSIGTQLRGWPLFWFILIMLGLFVLCTWLDIL